MRGVISMGMIMALDDLGMLDVFDMYVGVSAGALNLAYALAGQAPLGLSVYLDDLTDRDTLSLRRIRPQERPILDMRKVYEQTTRNKRLHLERLQRFYGDRLYVTLTNVSRDQAVIISVDKAGEHFDEYLVAGAIVPFVSGDAWEIEGDFYYDGGLSFIDPSQAAIELGATHTFVLNTRSQDRPVKLPPRIIEKRLSILDSRHPGAGRLYAAALKDYVADFNGLPFGETELRKMKLYRHALPTRQGLGRVTTDTGKLIQGMQAGYQSILDLFHRHGRVGIRPTLL